MTFCAFSDLLVVVKERRVKMNKVREVVEYQRKTGGPYERVELEPSMPRLCENNKSKSLLELAAYGNTVFRVKDGKYWAKL